MRVNSIIMACSPPREASAESMITFGKKCQNHQRSSPPDKVLVNDRMIVFGCTSSVCDHMTIAVSCAYSYLIHQITWLENSKWGKSELRRHSCQPIHTHLFTITLVHWKEIYDPDSVRNNFEYQGCVESKGRPFLAGWTFSIHHPRLVIVKALANRAGVFFSFGILK